MLVVPLTVEKNCCVLAAPVVGAMNAYGGEIVTEIVAAVFVIVMIALPLRDGSA